MNTLSIIIPVYNAEMTLRECVESILIQSYADYELILVNDGSTDMSKDICDEYAQKDARVKVVHKENGGVSSARNAGLEISSGTWVTFVDSDDYLGDNYFLDFDNSSSQDLLVGSYQNVYRQGVASCFLCENVQHLSLHEFVESYYNNTILRGPVAKFYKKSLIAHIRFPEDMKVGEDTCFVFQYLSKCKTFSVLPSAMYNVRLSEVADDIKYSVGLDYAINSLIHLYDSFDILRTTHSIGKDKFMPYIGYFKRVSKVYWSSNPYKWYFNKNILTLYKYVWDDLSLLQKIKLIGSYILMR